MGIFDGRTNPSLVRPHCQASGQLHAGRIQLKEDVSGGEAFGALFTGGLSLLATELSLKELTAQLRCGACGSTRYC